MTDIIERLARAEAYGYMPAQTRDTIRDARDALTTAQAEAAALKAEVGRLREMALPFVAIWSVHYARDYGLPEGSIHAQHYDLLVELGARVDDYTRWEEAALQEPDA